MFKNVAQQCASGFYIAWLRLRLYCAAAEREQESPAVADKPARRLRKVCTVYVRAVGL